MKSGGGVYFSANSSYGKSRYLSGTSRISSSVPSFAIRTKSTMRFSPGKFVCHYDVVCSGNDANPFLRMR